MLIVLQKNDWISIVFVAIFLLLAFANFLFEKRFRELISSAFSTKYYSFYLKETPLIGSAFNTIFLPINILTQGLTLFFIFKEYGFSVDSDNDFQLFLYISLALLFYFVLKGIVNYMFSNVLLESRKSVNFSFYKITFRSFSSIILLVFLLLHHYSGMNQEYGASLLTLVLLGLMAYGYIYSILQVVNKNYNSLYYIFLYLCALEIAPILIYVKYILDYIRSDFMISIM